MGEVKTPRIMFLTSIALVYTCAFASIFLQIPGLYGDDGIVPVRLLMPEVQRPLLEQLRASPSLLWLGPALGLEPQQTLEVICLLGVALGAGAVLLASLRDSLVFFCLWALYLSLYNVGGDFLRTEWDTLLLEAGFLAVLVAPFGFLCGRSCQKNHGRLAFWLVRWLFFRLVFGTGLSKLASGDEAWWGLTALKKSIETQVSPASLAWYVHQLPDWLLRFGAALQLHCEIVVPLLTFFNPIRRLRLFGFYVQSFQLIYKFMTENTFILPLSLVLSFSLLDDEFCSSIPAQKKKKNHKTWKHTIMSVLTLVVEMVFYLIILYTGINLFNIRINWKENILSSKIDFTSKELDEFVKLLQAPLVWVCLLSFTWEVVTAMLNSFYTRGVFSKLWSLFQCAIVTAAAASVLSLSMIPFTAVTGMPVGKFIPKVREAYSIVERFHLVGAYGIQHRMVSSNGRPEIILEGSSNGLTWKEMNPMYKPGSLKAVTESTGPYQPRLEGLMWQAAQGGHDQSPWFIGLVQRLLQGKPQVTSLLHYNEALHPFSRTPPVLIRAKLYSYRFTGAAGDMFVIPDIWWDRQYKSEYFPAVTLEDATLKKMLKDSGLEGTFPVQTSLDTPVSQALRFIRGQLKGLPGPLVVWTLLSPVVIIFFIQAFFSRGKKAKSASADHKTKKSSEISEKSHTSSTSSRSTKKKDSDEKKQDSDKSPRKRK